jgi:hypothetical protein
MRVNIVPDSLRCTVQAHTPHAESGRLRTEQLPVLSYQALDVEECAKVMYGKVACEICKSFRRLHPPCQLQQELIILCSSKKKVMTYTLE